MKIYFEACNDGLLPIFIGEGTTRLSSRETRLSTAEEAHLFAAGFYTAENIIAQGGVDSIVALEAAERANEQATPQLIEPQELPVKDNEEEKTIKET